MSNPHLHDVRWNGHDAIDLLCGGGGMSLGMHLEGFRVKAVLNHSAAAIDAHKAIFPDTAHFRADLRSQHADELGAAPWGHASPDCRHHSRAAAGAPRSASVRALAEEIPRYAFAMNALVFTVENVPEFLEWGPLLEDGKPDPLRKGDYYRDWLATMRAIGFTNYQYRILNAADYGTPQTRRRYIGKFARPGIRIEWEQPTHDVDGRLGRQKWRSAMDLLDLTDRGRSVFTRKKALEDATLRRLIAGIRKHVLTDALAAERPAAPVWLVKFNSTRPGSGEVSPGTSPTQPLPTVGCQRLPAVATVQFLAHYYSGGGQTTTITQPMAAVTTNCKARLVSVLITNPSYANSPDGASPAGRPATAPFATVIARQDKAPLSAVFITAQYGTAHNTAATAPCSAILSNPKQSVVTALFQNNGVRANDTAERLTMDPAKAVPSLTTNGGNLFLMTYYKNGGTRLATAPVATVTTHDRLAVATCIAGFTMAPQFTNQPRSFSDPLRTIVASRHHQYVVTVVPGGPAHLVDRAGDSEAMIELKRVCREGGIYDVLMRVLKVRELFRAQGFPDWYTLIGTATDQKKMIGNAVPVELAQAVARAVRRMLDKAQGRRFAPLKLRPVVKWEQGELFGKEVMGA